MKKLRPGFLCGRESEASLLACGRQAAHSHEYYNEFPHVRVLTRMPKQFLWIKSSIPEVCLPSRIMVMFVEFSFGVCFAILRRFICLCPPPPYVPPLRYRQSVCQLYMHWMAEWVSVWGMRSGWEDWWGLCGIMQRKSWTCWCRFSAMPLFGVSSLWWWVRLFI